MNDSILIITSVTSLITCTAPGPLRKILGTFSTQELSEHEYQSVSFLMIIHQQLFHNIHMFIHTNSYVRLPRTAFIYILIDLHSLVTLKIPLWKLQVTILFRHIISGFFPLSFWPFSSLINCFTDCLTKSVRLFIEYVTKLDGRLMWPCIASHYYRPD